MSKINGCVYFVKHKGLSPIKIGYTDNSKPDNRISSINGASPYGLDFIEYVNCFDARSVESLLHLKYKKQRLNGEWFDINYQDVENEIYNISNFNKEDIIFLPDFIIDILERRKSTGGYIFFYQSTFIKYIDQLRMYSFSSFKKKLFEYFEDHSEYKDLKVIDNPKYGYFEVEFINPL